MKFAVSAWNGRVAPLFDSSERFVVVEDGKAGEPASFPGPSAEAKADCLENSGVRTLLCGAISSEYQNALLDRGIDTVPFVAGPLAEVIAAWQAGGLERSAFSMPGCGCPRRRCRRRGQGRGRGRGQGQARGPGHGHGASMNLGMKGDTQP